MIKLFSKGYKHENRMVNIGQPPGRALFEVKSTTYLIGQDARVNIRTKIRFGMRGTLHEMLTYLPRT
jgi:hypothetical protein